MDEKDLTALLNKIDPKDLWAKVTWRLNRPTCPCKACKPCYNDWLEWGRTIYGKDISGFNEAVKEEEYRRKNKSSYRQGKKTHSYSLDAALAAI